MPHSACQATICTKKPACIGPTAIWSRSPQAKWERRQMVKDLKAFILRGNMVDLAVGVVIGVAFGAVIAALVKDLITPLVTIPGKTDFSNLKFTVRHSVFLYGVFLNAIVPSLLVATAVFFFVIVPMNRLMERRKTEPDVDSETRPCPECLSSIPVGASRCAFCTTEVAPLA